MYKNSGYQNVHLLKIPMRKENLTIMKRDSFDGIYYPENILALIDKNTDEKMVDHIRRANGEYLDSTAMIYMGIHVSYRKLFERIKEYALALKSHGLSKGDMITICLPNTPETIYYFYACNEIGVTPYLIDPRCTFNKMRTCILDSNSKLFICEMGTYYTKVAENEEELPVQTIVVVNPLFSFEQEHGLVAKQLIAKYIYKAKQSSAERKAPKSQKRLPQKAFLARGQSYQGTYQTEYDPQIPAIVVNTSGTSGDSVKGAVHSDKSYNILSNQTSFITNEIKRGYSYYGYIPFFSMYGSAVGMHTALSYGVVIDIIPTFKGLKSIREILDRKSNILIGVPSLFEKISKICSDENLDMSFAKVFVMGGDNVAPEKLKENNETLCAHGMREKIIFGYGSTEAMMMITTSSDDRSYIYGSSGIPHAGTRIRIIDPDTKEWLDYEKEGEIYIHTPTLMLGYLNKPNENKAVFIEFDGVPFFKTGDKGYLTKTGHLFFTGRYKRLMKRPDGHQVSPIPIENTISKHPLVADCAVVGLKKDDTSPGVIPTAFIKLYKEGQEALSVIVSDIMRSSLIELSGEREMALAYILTDEIPYTENGKMNYRALETRGFRDLNIFVVDDPITREYFGDMQNVHILKA